MVHSLRPTEFFGVPLFNLLKMMPKSRAAMQAQCAKCQSGLRRPGGLQNAIVRRVRMGRDMTGRTRNGTDTLGAAMALLVQNQAALVAQHTAFVAHLDEDRQRFARIERDLDLIK